MADTKETKKANRPGFDDNGKAYAGVDPKTGERVTVTLDAMRKEFGPKTGADKYARIAQAAGVGVESHRLESYAPDVQLAGASDDVQAKVAEILGEKE